MRPTVGRIVHYVSYGTPNGEFQRACRAAIVTEDDGDTKDAVGLCVLNPTGIFLNQHVPHREPDAGAPYLVGGTWHWPERADE